MTRTTLFALALALAGCSQAEQQKIADRKAKREASAAFYEPYNACLYRVTGPFSAASLEVMKECERQACAELTAGQAKRVIQCRKTDQ